jgi:L-fuculose-phosphate aldolase
VNEKTDIRKQLVRYYRWLRRYGLNDSHSGNASAREGETIWITPSGACADTLRPRDLLYFRLNEAPPQGASLDGALHLRVYQQAPDTGAVLHSHGPYSLAMSMNGADFTPTDFEGRFYFGAVPVVDIPFDGYFELAPSRIADSLSRHKAVIARGHGVYARGENLNLAYKWTCSLESSAKLAWLGQ